MSETTPTKKKRLSLLGRIKSTRKLKSGRGDAESTGSGPSTPERTTRATPSFESNRASSVIDLSPSLANSYDVISVPKISAIHIAPEALWDHAYDRLKSDQPELILSYEKILSTWLDSDEGSNNDHVKNLISQSREQRQAQLDRIFQGALGNIEKISNAKGNVRVAIIVILSLEEVISSGSYSGTVPIVIWSGLCVALELGMRPINQSKSSQDRIAILISRMKEYSALATVVQKQEFKSDELANLRKELAEKILDLYQAILEFTIKSVCDNNRALASSISKDPVNSDDWSATLDEVDEIEISVQKTLGLLRDTKQASDLVKSPDAQSSEREDGIMNVLYVRDMAEEIVSLQQQRDPLLPKAVDVEDSMELASLHFRNPNRHLIIWGSSEKGKTLEMMGIVQDLTRQIQARFDEPGLAYFLLRADDCGINSSTSILRGLIWMLIRQNQTLLRHLSIEFDDSADATFDGPTAFERLKKILITIIQDKSLQRVYLVVDALTDCKLGLSQFLDLVEETSTDPKVNWILSSREDADVREGLSRVTNCTQRHIVSVSEPISQAVKAYIDEKVSEMGDRYNEQFRKAGKSSHDLEQLQNLLLTVQNELYDKAEGSLLWAEQAINRLESCESNDILSELRGIPSHSRLAALSKPMMGNSEQTPHSEPQQPNFIATYVPTLFLGLGVALFFVEYRSVFSSVLPF